MQDKDGEIEELQREKKQLNHQIEQLEGGGQASTSHHHQLCSVSDTLVSHHFPAALSCSCHGVCSLHKDCHCIVAGVGNSLRGVNSPFPTFSHTLHCLLLTRGDITPTFSHTLHCLLVTSSTDILFPSRLILI